MTILDEERRKYCRMWNDNKYREQSDGLPIVIYAHHVMQCEAGASLIDWGCGTGRVASAFKALGLEVVGFDIADNCLDPGSDIPLIVGTLWNPPDGLEADYGFCSDVLEHIPPEMIAAALDAIANRSRIAAYIQVDTALDISGSLMNPPERLHLTVEPEEWWHSELTQRWRDVKPCAGSWSRAGFLCRN